MIPRGQAEPSFDDIYCIGVFVCCDFLDCASRSDHPAFPRHSLPATVAWVCTRYSFAQRYHTTEDEAKTQSSYGSLAMLTSMCGYTGQI